MTCPCAVCRMLRRLEPLRARATADERAALEELFSRMEHAETYETWKRLKERTLEISVTAEIDTTEHHL